MSFSRQTDNIPLPNGNNIICLPKYILIMLEGVEKAINFRTDCRAITAPAKISSSAELDENWFSG
jgi:hypothetical protein